MNTRMLNSLMLTVCPVLMVLTWMVLEPLLMGDIESGLEGRAQVAAYLELSSGKGALPYLINVPATFCLVATMLGIAFLGRSLQGNGAAFGSLSAAIFTVLIAIPIIGMGLSVSAMEMFGDGVNIETAITLDIIAESIFSGMPVFWALGIALLGLGLIIEKGFLPIWIGGLMLVSGLAGIPGVLALGEAGFIIWIITLVAAIASGVVLFMRRAQEKQA